VGVRQRHFVFVALGCGSHRGDLDTLGSQNGKHGSRLGRVKRGQGRGVRSSVGGGVTSTTLWDVWTGAGATVTGGLSTPEAGSP
jgi:hypothetical protein